MLWKVTCSRYCKDRWHWTNSKHTKRIYSKGPAGVALHLRQLWSPGHT